MKQLETIPFSVPKSQHSQYLHNMSTITQDTNNTFIFACDQKIEHLNQDFVGENILKEVADPHNLFKIAQKGNIGAMAVPFGLLCRYAPKYTDINYIVKLSGKTNCIGVDQKDPESGQLFSVDDVVRIKNEYDLSICGVGCTVYLGSEFESLMLAFATNLISQAHQHGLVAMLWVYPRGKAISNPSDPALLAGAAGLANALGADIVKISAPQNVDDLPMIVAAAGNTKLICAGGEKISDQDLLVKVTKEIDVGGANGVAIGRNIFQRPVSDAVALTKKIAKIVFK